MYNKLLMQLDQCVALLTRMAILCCPLNMVCDFLREGVASTDIIKIPSNIPEADSSNCMFSPTSQFSCIGKAGDASSVESHFELNWAQWLQRAKSSLGKESIIALLKQRDEIRDDEFPPLSEEDTLVAKTFSNLLADH